MLSCNNLSLQSIWSLQKSTYLKSVQSSRKIKLLEVLRMRTPDKVREIQRIRPLI